VVANNDPESRESLHSVHHDKPLNIFGHGNPKECIHAAGHEVKMNHTDEELELVEALVGRKPPFME
jgi:hypothetical protein